MTGLTKNTYVVIHFEEDIHSALKNMIKVDQIQYVSKVLVNVNTIQLPSKYEVHCSSYKDKCSDILLVDDLNGSLPFDAKNTKPLCKTHDEGLEVVKSRLANIENCQKPCLQLEIDYEEKPFQFLLSMVNPKYTRAVIKSSEDENGYVFHLPKYAKLISHTEEYSLSIALGYFGSMVGIFIGISVFSILAWLIDYTAFKANIKKSILILLHLAMSIYLLIVFIILGNKFLQHPQDTSVNFVKTTSDFSMTICSSIYIYGLIGRNNEPYVSNDMILMINESFWLKWTDPKNILDTIKISTGSNEIDLLDENQPIKFALLPVDNQTVAACHTFQMSAIKEMDSITLIYNEEIQVYFHNTGQLLYEWNKKQNQVLPATKENVQDGNLGKNVINNLLVYKTVVILKMERHLKLDADNYQSYHECVIDYGTEALGDDLMKCFFSKEYNNCTDIISNSSLTLVKNILESQNKCNPPQKTLLTSADKSVSLDRVEVKTAEKYSDKFDGTGSLGIKDKSLADKPKIEFIFPKFTKLSQVSLFSLSFNK